MKSIFCALVAAALCCGNVACGGASTKTPKASVDSTKGSGTVAGAVHFQGKPAPPGNVTLVDAAAHRYSAPLDAAGRFSFATPFPVGVYRLAIERSPTEFIEGEDIPERYRHVETSQVTIDVAAGPNSVILNLIK